jgi:hypothetical protein
MHFNTCLSHFKILPTMIKTPRHFNICPKHFKIPPAKIKTLPSTSMISQALHYLPRTLQNSSNDDKDALCTSIVSLGKGEKYPTMI